MKKDEILKKKLEKFPEILTRKNTQKKKLNNMSREVIFLFANTNYRSFGARERYERVCLKFIKFLTENFKVQKIKNINNDHIKAYIKNLKSVGEYTDSTITLEVCAIEYMMKKIKFKEYEIKSAQKLLKEVNTDV